jgi:hypothetical protein
MLLYKMHACVQHPDSMLITTYDYVRYIAMWRDKRAGMATEFRDLLLKRIFALHVLARCTALSDETSTEFEYCAADSPGHPWVKTTALRCLAEIEREKRARESDARQKRDADSDSKTSGTPAPDDAS